MTKDPIRFSSKDANLYGYCMQDPINYIDPSGRDSISDGSIGAGLVLGGIAAVGITLSGGSLGLAGIGFVGGFSLGYSIQSKGDTGPLQCDPSIQCCR